MIPGATHLCREAGKANCEYWKQINMLPEGENLPCRKYSTKAKGKAILVMGRGDNRLARH
jgi:hypothetical protein